MTTTEREPITVFPIGWRIPINGEEWIVLQVARLTGEHLMARTSSANCYFDKFGPLSADAYDQADWFWNDDIAAYWAGRSDDWNPAIVGPNSEEPCYNEWSNLND